LDLADISPQDVRRIISSWWFRFRRAIENTPTVLIVAAQASCVGSRATLALEVSKENVAWTSLNDAVSSDLDRTAAKTDSLIPFCSKLAGRHSEPFVRSSTHSSLLIPSMLRQDLLLQGLHLNVERQKPISLGIRKARVLASAQL
jgi:hypothetical protein